MAAPLRKTAVEAIKRFRTRELAGLMGHLRVFGPLPDPPRQLHVDKWFYGEHFVLPNPFLPKKNPKSGNWRPPKYSLRRQAQLVKMAKASGTLATLPAGPKKLDAELRAKRLRDSMSPAMRAQLAGKPAPATRTKPKMKRGYAAEKRIESLQHEVFITRQKLDKEKEKLKVATVAYDIGELSVFEADGGKENAAKRAEHRAEQKKRADEKAALEAKINDLQKFISDTKRQARMMDRLEMKKFHAKRATIRWGKVVWAGEIKPKKVAGVEAGTRLYSGKKRMFKGHLWERKRARRVRRHTILMRDMSARVERYKSYYKKRRPNPLKPSRYTKPPKLPF
ncbi:hypothetical protein CPB84DRAFT_1783348 [Gymnopilus junonius]|uniref:Large ribosomal subunit protein mL59 domain-containing protein n=1 Tax=Gymnopilus junonius TaxID=109634 RepID=A0A9P5NLC3_GYMJU|nr:hypothetical protein CPB84DRAFT_1783348 [Gymnopilus junonius]